MVEHVGPETHWRGQADTFDRRIRWLVLVSVLVHTPLTPLIALLGLFGWLTAPYEAPADVPPITAIPVDIFEEETPPPAAPEPPPPDPLPVAAPSPAKAPRVVKAEPTDKGVDAGVADAGPLTDAGDDAGPDAGTLGDGGVDGGIAEPVALSGDARKVVDPNANVRVTVFTEKIRAHPLGGRVGRLLGSIYQWRDFFGTAAIDPIRDVDRILIVGPELRNSAGVVAVLKLNLPRARIQAALDAIVKSDPEHGEWIDAGIPAARAYADRAPRVFVLPAPGVVVVTPPSAEKSALSLGKKTGIRPAQGDEVALAYVIKPSNLTKNNPILQLPPSLRWVRARLTPDDKGGGTIDIEAEDESPELAETNAKNIARQLVADDLRLWALQFPESRLVERAELHAEGAVIRGSIYVGPAWVQTFLNLADSFLVAPPSSPAPGGTPRGAGQGKSPQGSFGHP
jgi:hypothetical protein